METLPYNKDTNEFQVASEYIIAGKKTPFYAIHNYYGKNKFPDVDQNILDVRRQIWNFKDGQNAAVIANKIANAIKTKALDLNKSCLVIIPASTQVKTTIRFQLFCNRLSATLGIENAYEAIKTEDHEQTKGQSGGNKIAPFSFNPSYYKDKTVYLFDDVCTSGTSFKQVAEKLIQTGAVKVIGIFLGRTVSTYKSYQVFDDFADQNEDPGDIDLAMEDYDQMNEGP